MVKSEPKKQPERKPLPPDPEATTWYRIQFRKDGQIYSACSRIDNLKSGEMAMAQTEKGPEPAYVLPGGRSLPPEAKEKPLTTYSLLRRGTREENDKFLRLIGREEEAFVLCQKLIEQHGLPMKLIRVERFFNGSKVIFYFTAENRVDFRELVKDLVQEFRTRVEIRQIGVRHETKMIGGLGCCGRELCCSSFIKNFAPVSIKMAKEQNLSLNPAKISGLCNRLLCCLTYEFDTYHKMRRNMPKPGKTIRIDGTSLKVIQNNVLAQTITVAEPGGPSGLRTITRAEWERAEPAQKSQKKRQGKSQKSNPKQKGDRK